MESIAPLISERLMIEKLPELTGKIALVVSQGRAQVADELVRRGFQQVSAFYIDLYAAAVASQAVDSAMNIVCAADLPEGELVLVAMPVLT